MIPIPISQYWKKLNLFLMNGLINGLEIEQIEMKGGEKNV